VTRAVVLAAALRMRCTGSAIALVTALTALTAALTGAEAASATAATAATAAVVVLVSVETDSSAGRSPSSLAAGSGAAIVRPAPLMSSVQSVV
jgi:hypothetical protein